MAHEITIPRLGWNMEQGVFQGWLKSDGEAVKSGDMIFTLEGEKATEEIECLASGILRIRPDGPRAGDPIAVGTVIGAVAMAGEPVVFAQTAAPAGKSVNPPPPLVAQKSTNNPGSTEAFSSPRARRVAKELGIDWRSLRGTGRDGRIRERDVLAAQPRRRPARAAIAERLRRSLEHTSPVTLTTSADAGNLVNLRQQFKAAGGDLIPGYNDFLVKLAAISLGKHPELTGRWEGDQLVQTDRIHVGMAVDGEAGLLVPVIRDAHQLGLIALARRARELIHQARLGQLTSADMTGGVFTITNLGAMGIDAFTPIINYPECAILGVGRIQKLPVVVANQIVPRDRITLSLTFDHRRVDGAEAGRFLQTLVQAIENPGPGLLGG